MTLGTAYLVKKIVDEIFVEKNPHMLAMAPAVIIGLYVVSGVLRFCHMYLLRLYQRRSRHRHIRNDLQAKYTGLSLDFYSQNTTELFNQQKY